MDRRLQTLKRQYLADPNDLELAGRFAKEISRKTAGYCVKSHFSRDGANRVTISFSERRIKFSQTKVDGLPIAYVNYEEDPPILYYLEDAEKGRNHISEFRRSHDQLEARPTNQYELNWSCNEKFHNRLLCLIDLFKKDPTNTVISTLICDTFLQSLEPETGVPISVTEHKPNMHTVWFDTWKIFLSYEQPIAAYNLINKKCLISVRGLSRTSLIHLNQFLREFTLIEEVEKARNTETRWKDCINVDSGVIEAIFAN